MTEKAELFTSGKVAVITGAASGIGRAAAEEFAALGMRLVLFDREESSLVALAETLPTETRFLAGDVAKLADIEQLQKIAFDGFGPVSIVMNNAAIGGSGSDNWSGMDAWRNIIDVNLWGVVNGVHAFAPALLAQKQRAALINTGSKQGITNPPGYPAYAVAKAGVKTLTEQLAHGLRNAGPHVTAHLLVPGWTYTGLTPSQDGKKPEGAWSASQVIERMISAVDAGDFYIICPDNAVTSEMDKARILWSAQDMTENRPALSRWHPDWQGHFEEFMTKKTGG